MKSILYPNSYHWLFCLFFMIGCGCGQSSGQNNHDESDWSNRRVIPEAILSELPEHPDTLKESPHFQLFKYGDVDHALIDSLVFAMEASVNRLGQYTKEAFPSRKIKWHFYPSSELKGLKLKNTLPCQIDFEHNEIHFVANDFFKNHYLSAANELLLRLAFGAPKSNPLEKGFAILLAANWQGGDFRKWASILYAADQLPPLVELLDEKNWEYGSDLIFGCATASFCDYLLKEYGEDGFLEFYKNQHPDQFNTEELEQAWRKFVAGYSQEALAYRPQALPYLKGFNFAHEGYRIYNGYGSRKADQSLAYLKQMQANAVAIVPYSFIRHPKSPSPIPVVKRAGSESDDAVIQSAEKAQSLSLSVIMKPQIWVGRGMWTGDIDMDSKENWELFFKYYSHWICHYAMLSEIYGWDLLCIGNELVQTTLKMESEWRNIIRSVRAIYSGPITYAANWGDEFENISLWNDLDYIGLNCYYPLSTKDSPSNRELEKGFDLVLKKVEKVYGRFNKPILFTEIGFPCINAPWKEPHLDHGDFTPNAEHQRRCYEVVFKGIDGKPWCNGIFWWKFPANLDHAPKRNTGFSPFNKPAEESAAKWFSIFE